jgi:hypothetical protein
MKHCFSNTDCVAPQVCDLYVSQGSPLGYCTDPSPMASSGFKCSGSAGGYDGQCATEYCAAKSSPPVQGCMNLCMSATDCSGGKPCVQIAAPATIEGIPVTTLHFCTPP